MSSTSPEIYISYSKHDSHFAEELFDYLKKKEKRSVVMDDYQLSKEEILNHQKNYLKASNKVIILLSPKALNENKIWLLFDAIYNSTVRIREKFLCCIIKPCKVPITFQSFVCIDFLKGNAFSALFDFLSVSHDNLHCDAEFVNEVMMIYQTLNYQFQQLNKNSNFIIIDDVKLGLPQKAIVKCISTTIHKFIAPEIALSFEEFQSTYPNYNRILVSKKELEAKTKNDFIEKGIIILTYKNLLEDILSINTYATNSLNQYEQWKKDNWNGKNAYVDSNFKLDSDNQTKENVYNYIDKWLKQNNNQLQMNDNKINNQWEVKHNKNFLIILGDLGTGKTTTTRYLADQLVKKFIQDSYSNPIPVYIELKKFMKDWSFEAIIEKHFNQMGCSDINIKHFFRLWNRGKIVLLIDAFDVVAEALEREKQKEKFFDFCPRTNIAKTILTCRTHYFKNIDEQKDVISGSIDNETKLFQQMKEYKPETFVIYLQEFTDEQIKQYLQVHRKNPENDLKIIQSIYHLLIIARRPLLLDMIIHSLPYLDNSKPISSVELYEKYTKIWIEREEIENERPIMDEKNKLKLMLELSWRMWEKSTEKIHYTDLAYFLEKEIQKNIRTTKQDIQRVLHDTMTASFLKRDQLGNFSFMHKSFQEYFLAIKIYKEFLQKDFNTKILQTHMFQKEIIYFLTQMDQDECIILPLQKILINNYVEKISENALNILYWKGRYDCNMDNQIDTHNLKRIHGRTKQLIPQNIKLQTSKLSGIDLSGAYLEKADFSYSDLSYASFKFAILNNSKFDNTDLTKTFFNHASLQYANLTNANIENANFDRANVNGFDHTGIQNFEKANLHQVVGMDYKDIGLKKMYKPIVQTLGHCDSAITTDISPDKKYSASGGADGLVLVYEISNYRILWAFEAHTGIVNMVRFAHNSLILASSSSDKTVRIWDVKKGKEILELKDHETPVSCIAFSKDDQLLVCSSTNHIIVWDINNHKKIIQESFEPFVIDLAFSDFQSIYVKDIEQNEWHWKISDDGLIPLNKRVNIESKNHKEELLTIQPGHKSGILSLAISSNGNFLASADMKGIVKIWNLHKGLHHYLKEHDAEVTSVKFINTNTLISCGYDEKIRKWDLHRGKCIHSLSGHSNYINDITYSKALNFIASASNDRTIALWDTDLNNEATLERHDDWVKTICFSKDGKWLVSGGRDHKVILWDLASRKPTVFKGHTDEVTSVLFSNNQKKIITASMDRTISIWDIATKKHRVLRGHDEGINSLCMSSDTILASGSRDNTIRLWDISSDTCISKLTGNMGQVNAICFSNNNSVLISAGDAGRIQLWDYKRKNCILMMFAFAPDAWMFLMPDGRHLSTDKALSYLGYIEQDTLLYYKASSLMKEYNNPKAIRQVIDRFIFA